MRCKKHLSDFSSSVGVCSSCLRERLFALIAVQVQAQSRAQTLTQAQDDRHHKLDAISPPLVFPRSVSPYIIRRKSDIWHHHHHLSLPDQNFFSTPQVGPTGTTIAASTYKKMNSGKFSFISKLFRSKSMKPGIEMDPRVSDSGESAIASSWFSTILPRRSKRQMRTFSLDESSATKGHRKIGRNPDRGMSPAMYSDDEEENEHCQPGSSGYSSESSQGWKQTPKRTPAHMRHGHGGGRPSLNRNVSGIAFCLSPLVRASPTRFWNQKGMPPEVVVPGEIRQPVKPQLSSGGMSFCKNRSRKLADFGRFNRNH